MTFDRENYDEMLANIDKVGPEDISHYAQYAGTHVSWLEHDRKISSLIRAYGESLVREKLNGADRP